MQALTAVIAVLGTLLGSSVTYVFQRRIAERTRQLDDQARGRQERLDAFASYAGALHNYRRMTVHRWLVANERPDTEDVNAITREIYEVRADAVEAGFRVQLLTDEPGVRERATAALRSITDLHDMCQTRDELDVHRAASRTAIQDFITAAAPLSR
ncbi:hypothetical protein [Streptomyces sp. GSL17-111]|uniref:hypothetical protein n=1 Tax=Streptomyces sp. GSL17-111 TaxID=3121596 RepID=UPI0030F4107E